jgi:hypothetical protein
MTNAHLKDKLILSSLLMECFLHPFISDAVDEGLAVRFPRLKQAEFLARLSRHQMREAFLTALLQCHQKHFHTHIQTQLERAAATRLARFHLFKLDRLRRGASDGAAKA